MSQVQDIINRVSQDIRLQLSANASTPGQPILIDYTDRIQKQMLRFSRWHFILSENQEFMTAQGQTDYWIGPNAECPVGMVNTGLNLPDVDRMRNDSIRDLSNNRKITAQGAQPIGLGLTYRSGQSRQGPPGNFWHDHNDPFILHVYPAADNQNTYSPSPETPFTLSTLGGALLQRTYFVRITFVDTNGGESYASNTTASQFLLAGTLCTVGTPSLLYDFTSTGIQYKYYNVYATSGQEGSETLQNVAPIPLGINWTEPTSGLTTTGVGIPTANTLAPMGGYIIQFRYFKDRVTLTGVEDFLQIPDDYLDVVVHGVCALAWKLLEKPTQASASYDAYKGGLTEMVWDKNLFPSTDFIRPDPGSYVNGQRADFSGKDSNGSR
jgi:hypothetical protein